MPYSKVCPECEKTSYSASDAGSWICPYCGQDINKIDRDKDQIN